jgi:hypothetical protein
MQRRFTYHHFKKPINFLRSCIFGLIIFFNCSTHAQSLILNYKVVQNSKVIGWIKLEKKDSGDAYRLLFDCETKKRFLILITVIEKQQSFFKNGIMMQSSVYRKINNDIKVNKRTTYKTNYYEVNNKNNLLQLKLNGISYNQLSLYFFEPVNINKVYSEHYDKYLSIKKTQAGCYVIEYPDGSKNYYYYKNGICSKVKIVRSLFTAEFILSENF